MNENRLLQWVETVINGLPKFLENMKDRNIPGRYKYSLTGDIESNSKWGLGNTVYAVKIYYMLNQLNLLEGKEMATYIKSFGCNNGEIYDPLVQKISRINRFYGALRSRDWNNITGKQTRRAETRQSFAALKALGENPDRPYLKIPLSKKKIKKYIHSLDWNHPWGAGSHFSHLIFFLKNNEGNFNNDKINNSNLIDFAFQELEKYRHSDGAWYNKIPSNAQRINGAMKIVTALMAAGIYDLSKRKELIDLSLALVSDPDACNNFNLILVLYFCLMDSNERQKEIKDFCFKRLKIYREFYFDNSGGFSFLKNNANSIYYNAKISNGLKEPDIHGTHLFLWGIVIITRILKVEESFELSLPIT